MIDEDFTDRPYDYTARAVEKVIVLMTDGENTSQYYLYDEYRAGPSGVWRTNEKVNSDGEDDYIYSVYRPSRDEYYLSHPDDDIEGEYEDHPYGTGTITECSWKNVEGKWVETCEDRPEPGEGAFELTFPQLWAERSWDWYESFWWLDNPGSSVGTSEKDNRLDAICEAAKDEDITIFTIGFDTDWEEEQILKKCASQDSFYFDVEGLDLSDAFASIAREISKLKLVN